MKATRCAVAVVEQFLPGSKRLVWRVIAPFRPGQRMRGSMPGTPSGAAGGAPSRSLFFRVGVRWQGAACSSFKPLPRPLDSEAIGEEQAGHGIQVWTGRIVSSPEMMANE